MINCLHPSSEMLNQINVLILGLIIIIITTIILITVIIVIIILITIIILIIITSHHWPILIRRDYLQHPPLWREPGNLDMGGVT